MYSKADKTVFSIMIVVLIIATLGAFLLGYYQINELLEPVGYGLQGPTGPTGPMGSTGTIVMMGATGPRGPAGAGAQIGTLPLIYATGNTIVTNQLFYWNYQSQNHIFAAQLGLWQSGYIPLDLTFENNDITYYSYKNSDSYYTSTKTLIPSTKSTVETGDGRSTNYAGFDYVVVQTTKNFTYPKDPQYGQSDLESNEEQYYILITVNIEEEALFNRSSLYDGIILNPNSLYQINQNSKFVLTYLK